MKNLLDELLPSKLDSPMISGEWFSIQWMPDPGTGENLNIGVGFIKNDEVYYRLLDTYDRLTCLFDQDVEYHIEFVRKAIEDSFKNNFTKPPLSQVSYKQKGFIQGNDIDEVLNMLFSQVVTLAKPKYSKDNTTKFPTITNDNLYKSIIHEMSAISNLNYHYFVPEDTFIPIEGGKHKLYVPFRNNIGAMGSLASAVYSDVKTIELNLLKAARDVQMAIELKRVGGTPYVFYLKPGELIYRLPNLRVKEIENKIDEFDWHMDQRGITVASNDSIYGLAENIFEAMSVAA